MVAGTGAAQAWRGAGHGWGTGTTVCAAGGWSCGASKRAGGESGAGKALMAMPFFLAR